ncbi:MAG TPA: hypothetical protein VFA27_15270 [Vicinamibacterales bacterium]|nr:hypothetical protein [Vicinamibacterales bacterium]
MRATPPLARSAADAAEQRHRFESHLAQHGGEQRVVLEAVAAAALVEELPLEIVQREADRSAGLDREVLEQKRLAVCEVQSCERGGVRAERAGDADAVEIRGQSHGVLRLSLHASGRHHHAAAEPRAYSGRHLCADLQRVM